MEDIASRCTWADAQLSDETSPLLLRPRLPPELLSLILDSTGSRYLEALSFTARLSQHADALFVLYKPLYPELVARWMRLAASPYDVGEVVLSISCLARVLPFATYLRDHVRQLLASKSIHALPAGEEGRPFSVLSDDKALQSFLLALFRLLSLDRDLLNEIVAPAFLSSYLRHPSLSIRYLAVQCLCMVMHFADAFAEQMVEKYVGKEPIRGEWEGQMIDYRLLKLWEERRWKDLSKAVADAESQLSQSASSLFARTRALHADDLCPQTAIVGGILLPRVGELAVTQSSFVLTPTAKQNLDQLGRCLLEEKPILLAGPGGSGKTLLVHEAARLLNKLSSMITLHINEQTDAKRLNAFRQLIFQNFQSASRLGGN